MICRNCGAENPEGKRFCGDCGASLIGGSGDEAEDEPYVELSGFPWAPFSTRSQSKDEFVMSMTIGWLFMVACTVFFLIWVPDSMKRDFFTVWFACLLVGAVGSIFYWRIGRRGAG